MSTPETYDQAMARMAAQAQAAGGLPPPGMIPGLPGAQQPTAQSVVWAPGMPFNGTQQYLLTQPGVTWYALALAARSEDGSNAVVPPSPEVANSYDTMYVSPVETRGGVCA